MVRIGVVRLLDSHVDEVMRATLAATAVDAAGRSPPGSPRMRPRDRNCTAEKIARYRANPLARPRRDPYTGEVMSGAVWANGGREGM